jgi:N-acyl-D-amino-acid deacylase
MKVTHRTYWGKSKEVIELIDAARDRGVKVFAEHIAFTNSGNRPMNLSLIPTKYYGGTKYSYGKLKRALAKRSTRTLLRADIAWQIDKQGGVGSVEIIECRTHPEWIGKSLYEMMQLLEIEHPVEALLKIKETGDDDLPNGARFRSRQTLSVEDVARFAQKDWFGTVTDAAIYGLEGGFAQPRVFASFTNKITEFVQERKAITLEHAIRAGTGLPATMLSIPNRGLLEVGYKADIQVFKPEELAVNARWALEDSRAYSSGVYYVIVNGTLALDNGTPTFELAGRSIRNQDIWTD